MLSHRGVRSRVLHSSALSACDVGTRDPHEGGTHHTRRGPIQCVTVAAVRANPAPRGDQADPSFPSPTLNASLLSRWSRPRAQTGAVPPHAATIRPVPRGEELCSRLRAGPRSLGRTLNVTEPYRWYGDPLPDPAPINPAQAWHPECVDSTPGRMPMEPPTAESTAASGTLNPLCRVLSTLRSVYLCAIGPAPIISLTTDTPRGSNCSPKQFYSWARMGPLAAVRHAMWHGAVTLYCEPFQVTCRHRTATTATHPSRVWHCLSHGGGQPVH